MVDQKNLLLDRSSDGVQALSQQFKFTKKLKTGKIVVPKIGACIYGKFDCSRPDSNRNEVSKKKFLHRKVR